MRPFLTLDQLTLVGSASLLIAMLCAWAYFQTWPFESIAHFVPPLLLSPIALNAITQKHRHAPAGVLLIGPLANAGGLASRFMEA